MPALQGRVQLQKEPARRWRYEKRKTKGNNAADVSSGDDAAYLVTWGAG
jgi:hypothetical protein